jgi:DNA-binding CsgD family transcriptional regulator
VTVEAQLLRAEALALQPTDPAAGEALLDRAAALSAEALDPAGEAMALLLAGVGHLFVGDESAAALRFRAAVERTEPAGEMHVRSYALAGIALTAPHPPEVALETARSALRLAAGLDDPVGVPVVLEVMAHLATAAGRPLPGALLLGAADARWRRAGLPPEAMPGLRSRHLEGTAALRDALGDRAFDEAFRRGATWDADRVLRLALDDVVEEDEQTGRERDIGPLTPRELEVAELVGRGMSNKEVAEELVISHRTAQGHVENILRKLGFGSRTQVAAWVAERHARADTGS